MSPLITQLALGNGLVLMSALALPLVARKTRAAHVGWSADVVGTVWALLITAAVSIGLIQLMMAFGSIHGLYRYGYTAIEIALCFVAFGSTWTLFGPGRSARSKFAVPPSGPMAHPGN